MDTLFPSFPMERLPQKSVARVEWPIAATQPGRVYWQATFWPAEFEAPTDRMVAFPGQVVHVVAMLGNTLLVVPVS